MLDQTPHKILHPSPGFASVSGNKKSALSCEFRTKESKVCRVDDDRWQGLVDEELALTDYPTYAWKAALTSGGLPEFENRPTICRHLLSKIAISNNICPYGDPLAPIVKRQATDGAKEVKDAYLLSALRLEEGPFKHEESTEENKYLGIPKDLRPLYGRKVQAEQAEDGLSRLRKLVSLQKMTLADMKEAVAKSQQAMRFQYDRELVPLMNANPFDPGLHHRELTSKMIHDLKAYVELVNCPYRFFDLMQWLESDVALKCWRAANTDELGVSLKGELLKAIAGSYPSAKHEIEDINSLRQAVEENNSISELLSVLDKKRLSSKSLLVGKVIETAIAGVMGRFITLTLSGWRDADSHRRQKAITCPIGVPLAYMQSLRRKDQPYVTQEFSNHAHGGLTHWLQEHIWQRFCDRYPEKHELHPSEFFKQLGGIRSWIQLESEGDVREVYANLYMFADAIYELHMPNLANPANTNFWTVLQFYLPLMSPWP